MARVTVEDCLDKVENRFQLVLVASARARQLATGAKESSLSWNDDKPTVVALREIAEGLVDASVLEPTEAVDEAMSDISLLESELSALASSSMKSF